MTVLEGIQKSAEFLAKKNIDSPRLQAELLLAHLIKLPRMKLYLNFERALTPVEVDNLRELVRRRAQREPLQHIVGSTSFCGFEIAVNRHVLVPRPETELLAEAGWKFLLESTLQRAPEQPEGWTPTALDFGTGSGCIAIALAAKCPNARIIALDISGDALELAKQNAARNNVADRIEFLHGDGFEIFLSEGRVTRVPELNSLREVRDSQRSSLRVTQFDLIISNPPYIASAEIETLEPEVRDFDPRSALDGGTDGLDFYRRLAAESRDFLKPAGKIMMEFGEGQGDSIENIFENQKWIVEAIQEDYTHRARILIARLNL
ncbi:MAG: release factor glutamine methyltransferase [Verrucomicrobiota bacterium]